MVDKKTPLYLATWLNQFDRRCNFILTLDHIGWLYFEYSMMRLCTISTLTQMSRWIDDIFFDILRSKGLDVMARRTTRFNEY